MKLALFGSALGLSLAVAGAAFAETQPPPTSGAQLQELVVTAQRRAETAQAVPIALSVLSAKDLVERGVTTVNQLQYTTPNLQIVPAFGGGQPNFRLRGVGFDDYASNNTSTVGVYVNEVAYPFPVQTQGVIFDVDRVEVLRGPQGTLYGRNTTGGAINFITARPTRTLSAGVTAEYGRFDEVKAEGFVSGPVNDQLRLRFSGVTQQGGAWQENRATGEHLGDKDRWALRALADWTPAPNVDVLLDVHYGRDRSEGAGLYLFQPLAYNPAFPVIPADTDIRKTGWGGSSVFQGFTGISRDQKPYRDNATKGANGTVNIDLGGAHLTSITAYEAFDRHEYNDWDASERAYAGTFFATHAKVLSQELRLRSDDDRRFTWLVGAYYAKEDLNEEFASDFWESLLFDTDTRYRQHVRSISGFGQVSYKFTPQLKLVAGLRYENEKRELEGFVTNGVYAPNAAGAPFTPPSDASQTNGEWSGKLALEYTPTDDVLVYASASRGIKSGGFTAYNTPDVKLLHPIAPEVLWAYEVGFKSELLDRTLRLNGDVFYYDYQDQQVQSAIFTAFGPIGNIVNADARIWGAELELDWRPLPQLLISQSFGYQKGKFTNFQDLDINASVAAGDAVFVSRDGQDEGFPPLSYIGSASYTWNVGDYDLVAEGNYAFHDTASPVLLGPAYVVDSYWLANANLTLSPRGKTWSVGLWGRNIFNSTYDLTRNFFLPGISIAAPGQPATYGVRVSLRY